MNFRIATLLAASFFGAVSGAVAQTTPAFRVERVASGLDLPLFVTQAPGDPGAIYVVEEQTNDFNDGNDSGQITRVDLNTGAQTSFLRIQNVFPNTEGGLRSLAFHPDFETNGRFYVGWVTIGPPFAGQLRLDEYTVDSSGTPALSRILLDRPNLVGANHSLNYMGFDPTVNYDFPASNPFANDGDVNTLGEILHSGLRNPFQASFDRVTGDFYIGDVGFNSREEINVALAGSAGLDFGWARREGTIQTPERVGGPLGDSIDPVFELTQGEFFFDSQGAMLIGARSITGGVVYRGPIQELQGQYFFGEAGTRDVLTATFDNSIAPSDFDGNNFENVLIVTDQLNALIEGGDSQIGLPVAFGEDVQGNLYICDFGIFLFGDPFDSGEVFRIVPGFILGDANQDGIVNFSDIPAFIAILQSGIFLLEADVNQDGTVDFSDIPPFIAILAAS